MFLSKQSKNLYKLAKKVDKSFKKINISQLKEKDIETLIKFNKAIDNLSLIYEKYIKVLENKKGEKWNLREFLFLNI